jgi:hypothetical protein
MSSSGPTSEDESSGRASGTQYPDCKFDIITNIASPIPAIVSTLKVGEILDVVLQAARGPVALITSSGQQAGGVLFDDIAELIQCLSQGNEYKAKVIEKKGGNVQVRIKNA